MLFIFVFGFNTNNEKKVNAKVLCYFKSEL